MKTQGRPFGFAQGRPFGVAQGRQAWTIAKIGTTTHVIEPGVEGRFVRVNISRPTYNGERVATIYELEAYGADGRNLALGRPATGSQPCSPDRTPDKAVNGSVTGGKADSW